MRQALEQALAAMRPIGDIDLGSTPLPGDFALYVLRLRAAIRAAEAALAEPLREPAFLAEDLNKAAFPISMVANWPTRNKVRFTIPLHAHPPGLVEPAPEPVAWYYERDSDRAVSFAPDRDPSKPWVPLYVHPPAPPAPPSRSQLLRAAGFVPRDRRLVCDTCGKKFSMQMLPVHRCKNAVA